MENGINVVLRRSCQLMLRPIASVLMKCGMTWKEFADIAKSVFVDVATKEFGIRGRPTNISRVSILTGISRKEVKRQRDLLSQEQATVTTKVTDATRLLSGWHQDPVFIDGDGGPMPLAMAGPAPSFEALFARYGGDTPAQTLLKELTAAGSIATDALGRVVARTRYHMPVAMSEGNIRFFGSNLFDHAHTLNRNITGSEKDRRFEGFAVEDRIDPAASAEFKNFVDRYAQEFLEDVDDWLSRHRVSNPAPTQTPIRLGVGLYVIDGALPEGHSS